MVSRATLLAVRSLLSFGLLIVRSSFGWCLWFFRYHSLHLAPLPSDVVRRAEERQEVVELGEGDVEGLEIFIYLHLSGGRQAC